MCCLPTALTRRAAITLSLLVALVAGGCGTSSAGDTAKPVSVLLDWTPNPAHAGLLTALASGLDRSNGVAIKLRTPGSSADGVRLLLSERADFAVLDVHDLAIAQARGRKLVGVMAVVGKPLAALIARNANRPRDLTGRTVAVTGAPSDLAVTKAVVNGDGGDSRTLKIQSAGFGAIESLLGGRVDAATGFFNQEGVALGRLNRGYKSFRLDSFGAPAYPELVLTTLPKTVEQRPELVQSVVTAFVKGTETAVSEPELARASVQARVKGSDTALLAAQTQAALGALLPPNRRAGTLDTTLLKRWSRWEAANGIVRLPPKIDTLFDPEFADKASR